MSIEEKRTLVNKILKHISIRARDTEDVDLEIYPREVSKAIGEDYLEVRSFLRSFAKDKTGSIERMQEYYLVCITIIDDYPTRAIALDRLRRKYKKEGDKEMVMDKFVYKCEGYRGCGTEVRFEKGHVPEAFECPKCGLKTVTHTYRLLNWVIKDVDKEEEKRDHNSQSEQE
jgi:predicted RNA-binding Zn-ribbon protein involved in translation (DUF1610 family)